MITSVFWNTSHKRLAERTGDPLGFDALREAMADCLVPHLTGATNHADDYLWVLIGLRWARTNAQTTVDADVWEEFRKFERALKQYWHKFTNRSDYLGKLEVKKLCAKERPSVNQPILKNERATGLLGTYLASLRVIGLVEKSALAPTTAGEQLVRGIAFTCRPRTFTSWSALRDGYGPTERDVRRCRKALGIYLFRDEHMRCAATAIWARATAPWSGLAALLGVEQRRVANACAAVLTVEKEMVEAFRELLDGNPNLSAVRRARVKVASARARNRHPIPDAWSNQPIAKALEGAWSACIDGRRIEQRLLDLHIEIVQSVRGNIPWIADLGEKSEVEFRPAFAGRDFRRDNLERLVRETKWSPNAVRA